MDFRLLGPLEVTEDSHPVALGGPRARAMLAFLLVHRNEVVAIDRIVDALWDGQPPKTAEHVVRVYVSQLRKALEHGRAGEPPQVLVTHGSGYVLKVDPDQVDVERFGALRAEGRRLLEESESGEAAQVLREALALWRGPPLQDFTYEAFAQPEIARLEEVRLATLEDRFDAELGAGRDSELVPDLERLVEANPLRERLRGQLMLALYRSGRQADALETYRRGRRLVVDELGLEPSETLRGLETRILQRDPELERTTLARPSGGAEGPPRRRRRPAALWVAAVCIAAAAAIALLLSAASGHSQRLRPVGSLRVALVLPGSRKLSERSSSARESITGLEAARRELGLHARVLYGTNELARAALSSNLVVVGAATPTAAVTQVAQLFPTTRFLVFDSANDPSFAAEPNVTGVNFDYQEIGLLGGFIAGLMTPPNHAVSVVGGIATDQARQVFTGFRHGARSAHPGIVVLGPTQTSARDACGAAASRQIRQGSAVILAVGGESGCGLGALLAAERRGVWGLGVDGDFSNIGPQILGSVVKRFDTATRLAIERFAAGKLSGRALRLDLASGGVSLIGISSRVPQPVRTTVRSFAASLHRRDVVRDAG